MESLQENQRCMHGEIKSLQTMESLHISEFQGKATLHARRRHLHIAMLFFGNLDNPGRFGRNGVFFCSLDDDVVVVVSSLFSWSQRRRRRRRRRCRR